MPPRYAVFLHVELLEVLPKQGSQRHKVLEFARSLADNPFATGDFTDKDATRRIRQIKIIGDFAVVFWTDHPVQTVMVVEIRLADR